MCNIVLSSFIIDNRMHTIATNCPNSLVIYNRLQTTDCLTKRSYGSSTGPLTASLWTILNSYIKLLLNDGERKKLSSNSGTIRHSAHRSYTERRWTEHCKQHCATDDLTANE